MRLCAEPVAPEAPEKDESERYSVTEGGVKFLDTVVGTGDEATAGSVVRIAYTASLLSSGEIIGPDGGQSMRLELGQDKIVFWEEAVEGMRVGGTRRLLVPPSAKLQLRSESQRDLVPEGETVRFECKLLDIETNPVVAFAVRSGIIGASGKGRQIRTTLLLLSLIPYFLPESIRPALWQSGSTSEVLVNAGIIEESVDRTPSPLQQQRLTRDEERLGEEIFGASIEQELYGR